MFIPPLTAAQRMQLRSALGADVLQIAKRLQQAFAADGRAPASLWKELLETLYRQHTDAMGTPIGQLLSVAVFGRIAKERGVGHPANGLGSALRTRG
jgi:hypothetical protein